MDFGKRVALLAALAILVAAAALGGTADRSAAESIAPTHRPRPAASSRSADARLLRYAKSQATRFVGPYGFGGPVTLDATAAAREGTPAPAAPKQGVDFSGTNVQEEGVDEPDIVKTNGNTLFAVANGKLNAVDVRTAKPQLLDSLKLDPGRATSCSCTATGCSPLARRLLGRADARDRGADDAVQPAGSVLTEIDVSNPQALRVVRTLTSTARTFPRGSSGERQDCRRRHKCPNHCRSPAQGQTPRRGSPRQQAQPRRRRLVPRSTGCRPTGSSELAARRAETGARPVPPRPPAGRLLGARHADGADDRSLEGARARSTRSR